MKPRTKLTILKLLGGPFGLAWIAASVGALYFLYDALANDGPWMYVIWSIVAGLVAKTVAGIIKDNQRRLDYIDQLTERGYRQADAEAAWRTATGGGTNLLRNLQQAEITDEITRLESAIGVTGSKNLGD